MDYVRVCLDTATRRDTHVDAPKMHSSNKHKWSPEITSLRKSLVTWFDTVSSPKRDIPWRETEKDKQKHAYQTWISEIMCQQTQVSTVVAFFNRWMEKFPTIADLASSSLDSIHQSWKGLGYYSRATRIHEAAQIIVQKTAFPSTSTEMIKLPGVGSYTANAIASIVFDEPVAALDGNFIRVLSRLLEIHASPQNAPSKKLANDLYNKLGDDLVKSDGGKRPGTVNQAIFDLGALVCTPTNPKCGECPISSHCLAYQSSLKPPPEVDVEECSICLPRNHDASWWAKYPPKPIKKDKKAESHQVFIIESDGKYLLQQRPNKGLLAGLWQFPFESPVQVESVSVGEVTHVFSHIVWTLDVQFCTLKKSKDVNGFEWVDLDRLQKEAIGTAFVKCWSIAQESGLVKGQIAGVETGKPAKKRQREAEPKKDKKQRV
jgi:A/G-specific adenine glycosylase